MLFRSKDKPNTKFLLETKKTKHNSPKNMEELLAASIKKYHMQDRVMIHSFSAPSLKTMSQLLPDVPRIFIVGSLQRINFEVLSYVKREHGDLLDQLGGFAHAGHQMAVDTTLLEQIEDQRGDEVVQPALAGEVFLLFAVTCGSGVLVFDPEHLRVVSCVSQVNRANRKLQARSEEHTSELQSQR